MKGDSHLTDRAAPIWSGMLPAPHPKSNGICQEAPRGPEEAQSDSPEPLHALACQTHGSASGPSWPGLTCEFCAGSPHTLTVCKYTHAHTHTCSSHTFTQPPLKKEKKNLFAFLDKVLFLHKLFLSDWPRAVPSNPHGPSRG